MAVRRFASGRLGWTYEDQADLFFKQSVEIYEPIARASSAAIRQAADQVKARGRANIAAAGFGRRWQDTLRVDTYPTGNKVSANAAALVYHKISYADVFEQGATIRGNPLLWLPLKSTPKRVSRLRMTPKRFVQEVGPLVSMTRNTSKPLLGAPMAVSKSAAKKGPPFKVTIPALRKAADRRFRNDKAARIYVRTVPLFHGVRSVTLRRRFAITEIIAEAVKDLPALYAAALKDE